MTEEMKYYEIETQVVTHYFWRIWGTSPENAEHKWAHNFIPSNDEYEDEPSDPIITEVEPEDYEEDDYEEEEEEE